MSSENMQILLEKLSITSNLHLRVKKAKKSKMTIQIKMMKQFLEYI